MKNKHWMGLNYLLVLNELKREKHLGVGGSVHVQSMQRLQLLESVDL